MPRSPEYYAEIFYLSEPNAQRICHIADRVVKMWEGYPSIPYFTTHGHLHNETILDFLARLMPESMKLPSCELERYLLLAAAWLHDVGMLDLEYFRERFRHITVRAQHHERSARWLQHHAAELGLCAAEADIVAYLVKMHRKREDIEHCPQHMFVGSQKVRARFMAALLRLADALHVDETRAPLKEYSLYRMTGMPPEAKFHWVKARAVQGIDLNLDQGQIEVQVDVPKHLSREEFRPLADFIRQEIEDEVETVRHTLAKEGCPLFMDVTVRLTPVPGLERGSSRANEIEELNSLISIDVSPNARRLATVILQSIEKIGPKAEFQVSARELDEVLENLRDYAKDLVPKIVARRCHVAAVRAFVALVQLLKGEQLGAYSALSLRSLLADPPPFDPNSPTAKEEIEKNLVAAIDQISFPSSESECRDCLDHIHDYFLWERQRLDDAATELQKVAKERGASLVGPGDRILLYGTSASCLDLLKALTEAQIKENLEIFVAECRVKSNYSSTNKIIYNDGIEYARRVAQKGYKKVAIIPDAAIAHLLLPESYYQQAIETPSVDAAAEGEEGPAQNDSWLASTRPINKVFFGFNGLDLKDQFVIHSCGHLALALLAKQTQSGSEATSIAEVYLVGTSNKCGTVYYKHMEPRSIKTWLTGDTGLLEDEEYRIADYNPIDDMVKLDLVDRVISDLGILRPEEFVDKAKTHLDELDSQLPGRPESG